MKKKYEADKEQFARFFNRAMSDVEKSMQRISYAIGNNSLDNRLLHHATVAAIVEDSIQGVASNVELGEAEAFEDVLEVAGQFDIIQKNPLRVRVRTVVA